jgi:diguanylate cyclase (GGDEF)-like protein
MTSIGLSAAALQPRLRGLLARSAAALLLAGAIGAATAVVAGQDDVLAVQPELASPLLALDSTAQDVLLRARSTEFAARSGQARDPRDVITIVAIDERTLAELGAYNGGYPRRYQAEVVEHLLEGQPRVIGLDFGFFEPTPDDAWLAAAFGHARSLPAPTAIVIGAVGLLPQGELPQIGADGEIQFENALQPVPMLAERAEVALANTIPDARGSVRSMPLVARVGQTELPSFGLAVIGRYLRRPSPLDGRDAHGTLRLAGRDVPVDTHLAMRINYAGPPSQPYRSDGTFRVVSFVDVLRGRLDPTTWRGGIVLVGALGATGLADDYWTPTSDQGHKMSGVEIHANVAATLYSNQFLREVPAPARAGLIGGLAAIVALLAANLCVPLATAFTVLVLAAYAVGSAVALDKLGVLPPVALPELAGLVSFAAVVAARAGIEQRRGRALRAKLASTRAEGARQARQDPLTGLPNRTGLQERLRLATAEAKRAGEPCSLLLLDLDRFKDINDSLGHQAGDSVLRQVASRLRLALDRSSFIARLGGDEFAVLLPGLSAARAELIGAQLVEAIGAPVELDGQRLVTPASVGVAEYPAHAEDAASLLRRAELAMYQAKHAQARVASYTPALEQDSALRLTLVGTLGEAIASNQLVLFCQPKLDCRSGQVAGLEALVRWRHPTLGLVPPDQFVRLAEETGLIRPLTRWVLTTAVGQWDAWHGQGFQLPVAVNLSAHDLQDPELPGFVAALLASQAMPPDQLSVEITESALVSDQGQALTVLNDLARLGVRASLDDYGTGYASLAYLRELPLHELKIDRSFVRDLAREARDQTIVRSTIELGHSLGLVVVAEGVEEAAALELLADLGCDLAQGYLMSRPMPAEDVPAWLASAEQAAA